MGTQISVLKIVYFLFNLTFHIQIFLTSAMLIWSVWSKGRNGSTAGLLGTEPKA